MKKVNNYSTLSLVTAGLLIAGSVQAIDIRIGDTSAARIAKDAHLPGKGVPGQCLPFAAALHGKLQAAGIPSEVLVYGYEATPGPGMAVSAGKRGAHAVVLYQDGGRSYVMDNQSWAPQWLHEAAPLQMAQQFSGIACNVRVARMMNGDASGKSAFGTLDGSRIAGRQ
jgi:hypothetical protein